VLHSTDGVDQVVLVDAHEARLQSLARSYPSAPSFTSLDHALPTSTPSSSRRHRPATCLSRCGRSQPASTSLSRNRWPDDSRAHQLINAAAAAGVVLMTGHTFEYNPAVWKLRELVQSAVLGDVYYLDSGG